jgi:hypothetical protein
MRQDNCKFKTSLGYRVRHCIKGKKKKIVKGKKKDSWGSWGDMPPVVKYLPSKGKTLSLNPRTSKNKNIEEKQ